MTRRGSLRILRIGLVTYLLHLRVYRWMPWLSSFDSTCGVDHVDAFACLVVVTGVMSMMEEVEDINAPGGPREKHPALNSHLLPLPYNTVTT